MCLGCVLSAVQSCSQPLTGCCLAQETGSVHLAEVGGRANVWLSFRSLALSTVFLPTVSIHSVSACGGELGRHQLTLWLELIGSLIFHVSPHTAKIYRRFDWFLPISVHGRFLLTLPGMKVAIVSSFLENVYYFLRFTLCRLLCVLCSMMNFKTMVNSFSSYCVTSYI